MVSQPQPCSAESSTALCPQELIEWAEKATELASPHTRRLTQLSSHVLNAASKLLVSVESYRSFVLEFHRPQLWLAGPAAIDYCYCSFQLHHYHTPNTIRLAFQSLLLDFTTMCARIYYFL